MIQLRQGPPRRVLRPATYRVFCPRRAPVFVAGRAWIWDPVLVRHLRSDEAECVGVHERGRHPLGFNRRHVTRHTSAPRASSLVMRMFFERGRVGAIGSRRSMTIQANLIRWLSELRVVGRAMHVMARGASDPMPIHDALGEVVSLHPIFVRRAVGEVIEGGLTQSAVFELPVVGQL